jgi:murein L,D-transpeptidase YafK
MSRPIMLGLAVFAFLCLPALASFAEVQGLRTTARSNSAYEASRPRLEKDLQAMGLSLGAPVYLVIVKEKAELTAYIQSTDGTYKAFRTWPVCAASGSLGPKQKEGDGQAPEGFYVVRPGQMNPSSSYHLSFDLGYPNARDRALGYTGKYLMVHGNCVSIGCYAMTDPVIEDIWTLMQAAYEGGQRAVPVHAYPFEMTAERLQFHAGNRHSAFWRSLAPAWESFARTGRVPLIRQSRGVYSVSDAQ